MCITKGNRMKITVIGSAGTIGSCTVFALICKNLADEILMIDSAENVLYGHWLDLVAVGANQGVNVRNGSYADMVGTDIIIICAGAPIKAKDVRAELLPGNLPIIRDIAQKIDQYCVRPLVIMETNPVDPLNYAMYLLSADKDRRRFIGYSLNDSLRFRMWSAEALGVNATRVGGTVIGEHGDSQVMLFSSLLLDGKPVNIEKGTRVKIKARHPLMLRTFESLVPKRTPGWTTSYGTALLIEAIKNNTHAIIPCNTVLTGEYNLRGISLTVPVILGKTGIEKVQELELTPEEKQELERTVQTLRPHMQYVEKCIGSQSGS
jgi:malate dehydrogenase